MPRCSDLQRLNLSWYGGNFLLYFRYQLKGIEESWSREFTTRYPALVSENELGVSPTIWLFGVDGNAT